MNMLFYAMVFVLLGVNINIDGHSFGLLPDFIGYFLMMWGLESLGSQSRYFAKARPVAMGMIAYSAVLYVVDALAVTVYFQFWSFCLSAVALAVRLLLSHWIVSGVQDVERSRNWNLEGEKLRSMWIYAVVISVIATLCSWVPVVGQIAGIAEIVVCLLFLAAFYQSKKRYEAQK